MFLALGTRSAPGQGKGNALLWPAAIAYDAGGNLYIADSGRNQVFEATLGGALLVVAGTGTQGYGGDGGAATAAQLNGPGGVAVGPNGTIYIADTGNARVRAVTSGVVATLAGTGQGAFGGDGGVPAHASFRAPASLALDGHGGLLICDTADHRVRRAGLGPGGLMSTIAGTGVQGYGGDGGPATAAELDLPGGMAVAGDGRVFIADTHNRQVRVISATGLITVYAGDGTQGSGGDGGPAVSAQLREPRGLAMASDGTLWIGDGGSRRVRQVGVDGTITTLAGTGLEGAGAEGDLAAATPFRTPRALAVSTFGLPAIGDTLNGTVRLLTEGNTLFQPAALASGRAASRVEVEVASAQVYGSVNASVSVTGPVGVARGGAAIVEAGSVVASTPLRGGGAALPLPAVAAGSHTWVAMYGGDGLNAAASSNPIAATVQPLAITAVANSASAVYGTANPAITGSLQGVLRPDAGQVEAVFAVAAGPLAPVGTYPISATLTGSRSGNYVVGMAANSGTLQITPAGSSTALAALAQGYAGFPLRLTAHVASSTTGQPTGTVQFLDGGAVVATGALVNGSVSGIEVVPSPGAHNLTAVYPGDVNFLPSTSAVEVAHVDALPDFSIALSGGNSATVTAGSSATFAILLGASPAPFTGEVTFSASGLPPGATATFSPVGVVPGASSATVTLTVQTPASLARLPSGGRTEVWFGCLGLLFTVRLRRARLGRAALFLFAGCFLLAGCGARTVGDGTGVSATKTYPLGITGTSTNLLGAVVTHSTTATLIVGQ